MILCSIKMARRRQLELDLHRRGGPRPGAGRKPNGPKAGVSHLRRPPLAKRFPVHVTLRVRPHVYNLRSRRCFRLIREAFVGTNGRFGFRLNHYSVQGNHLHLIVESEDSQSLARGMQSLTVRIAKPLNRLMQRRGRVFADRYHSHILRTPNEVRRALSYVLQNLHKHSREYGRPLSPSQPDPYSSALVDATGPPPIVPPRTWLLRSAI